MFEQHFICHTCGTTYSTDHIRYRCDCGGPLDITYDYNSIRDQLDWQILKSRTFDHNRYRELYPIIQNDHIISLGEGGTPLLKSSTIGDSLGLDNLYFKLEGLNPSGSFKDRGTAVEIGKALDFGAEEIVVASTGNMGASIAAYCARAGITAHIFIPDNVSPIKHRQMQAHGAELHHVDGDYATAAEKAMQAHEANNWYLMGDYAYRGEGEKSVGYELVDQIDPDAIVMPVGNGTLMHGTYKGITDMQTLEMTNRTPRMVGIQASGCSTVSTAFKENRDTVPSEENVDTEAGAIACADPLDGAFALDAIRESDGFADDVTDQQISNAVATLASKEGIYPEFTCGAALAGIQANRDRFDKDDTVICIVTGHGLKT